jgi:phosphoglucomutase
MPGQELESTYCPKLDGNLGRQSANGASHLRQKASSWSKSCWRRSLSRSKAVEKHSNHYKRGKTRHNGNTAYSLTFPSDASSAAKVARRIGGISPIVILTARVIEEGLDIFEGRDG